MTLRIKPERIVLYAYMTFYCIILAGPIFYLILCSFKNYSDLYVPAKLIPFVQFTPTLQNYLSPHLRSMGQWLLNSFITSLSASVIAVIIGLFAGFTLSRARGRFFDMTRSLLVLAYLFPVTFLVIGFVIMLNAMGLVNTYPGLIIAYATFNIPYVSYLIKVYVDTVPIEIDESALVDGCPRWQYVLRILTPITRPVIVTAFLWTFMWSWNEYLYALMILSSNNMLTVPVGLATLQAGDIASWGEVFAFSVYYSIVPLLIFAFAYRYFVGGLTAGAVKG